MTTVPSSVSHFKLTLRPLGAPCSGVSLLSMLGEAQPTTSSLNLVSSEVSDTTTPDGGISMADLVESLDTRELDMGEGEEADYDGNLGASLYCLAFQDDT